MILYFFFFFIVGVGAGFYFNVIGKRLPNGEDLFEPEHWNITEDALSSINFNTSKRQFQSYIINYYRFTKK